MSFRHQITAILLGLTIVTSFATAAVVGYESIQHLKLQMAESIKGIVTTASLQIDGDEFARIVTESNPAFNEIRQNLDKIGRSNPAIANIYSGKGRGDNLVFIVDGYSKKLGLAAIGETYPLEPEMRSTLEGEATINPELITDEDGTWISGYAPIKDSQGNTVGMVGADYSAETVMLAWKSFITSASIMLIIVVLIAVLLAMYLSGKILKPVDKIMTSLKRLEVEGSSGRLDIKSPPEFAKLADAFNNAEKSIQERDAIKSIFGTFLEKHVAEKILADMGPEGVPGELRQVTVLFADIRGYTTWSEKKHPVEMLDSLNYFFGEMIDIILEHGGIIDKFIGDAVMVLFGAPGEAEDQSDRAVSAAIQMQAAITKLKLPFEVGIGINTDDVVLGTIGSPKRLSYTAMGDGVNLAQRLESNSKPGQIIISESTKKNLVNPAKYKVNKLSPIKVKGKSKPVEILEVIGFAKKTKAKQAKNSSRSVKASKNKSVKVAKKTLKTPKISKSKPKARTTSRAKKSRVVASKLKKA